VRERHWSNARTASPRRARHGVRDDARVDPDGRVSEIRARRAIERIDDARGRRVVRPRLVVGAVRFSEAPPARDARARVARGDRRRARRPR
jgi:hypothetical protein